MNINKSNVGFKVAKLFVSVIIFASLCLSGCSKDPQKVAGDAYHAAMDKIATNPEGAIADFVQLGEFENSKNYSTNVYNILGSSIAAGFTHSAAVTKEGKVLTTKYNGNKRYYYNKCEVDDWTDIVAVDVSSRFTVGLKSDGTARMTCDNTRSDKKLQSIVHSWSDLVMIACGEDHVLGLKADGTVVAAGSNDYGQSNVKKWKNIIKIASSGYYSMGLKSNGTVVFCGDDVFAGMGIDAYDMDVEDWDEIIDIDVSDFHMIGLRSDGTVVATGNNDRGQCEVEDWTDIVSVSGGDAHSVGLKKDGTVIYTTFYEYDDDQKSDGYKGQCDVGSWNDIVAISAGSFHTIGLKRDGTVVSTQYSGYKPYASGQDKVSHFVNVGPFDVENRRFVNITK